MKKLSLIMGMFLCAMNPLTAHDPPVIIDTVQTEPNPQIILNNEIRETKHWEENCSDTTIQLSYEDSQRMLKIAWAEAGNQGVQGQLRVIECVWNRVQSTDYPDSIAEVISQPGQFESYQNGRYDKSEPTGETREALALFESNKDLETDIIAFETSANGKSLERYFSYLYTYGDHDFYIPKQTKNP